MFKLEKGSLSMDNTDLDNIKALIDVEGMEPKDALRLELEKSGLDIKDVNNVEISGKQMKNMDYCEVYSKIVCSYWNNK